MGLILDEATNGLGTPSNFIENPILAEVEEFVFIWYCLVKLIKIDELLHNISELYKLEVVRDAI
jgi:hypothetical protein